ncbi:MAG: choline/carnitine O-acyltransferase [Ornithinimicrobium sp.]|uniref:choline/carnitine O-acyltransferase n=1 Tax=Ornithinimicrobium sp. TaxID=1977084 RepID=UPI003D9B0766
MDYLPVPPLAQTLQKYLAAVSPLLSPLERQRTEQAVVRTLEGDGPACQAELEAFAETENAQGRSWLSAAWSRGYLAVRTPLPLTSNVGFQIRVPAGSVAESAQPVADGNVRAAAVIHRLAAAHLAWLRGELPPEHTPRRQSVCGVQREVLAGGLRHPAANVDHVRSASQHPARREIGLLLDDRFLAVPISDERGQPLPAEALERAIDAALDLAAPSESRPVPGFTALSYLGSEAASAYLDRLLHDPDNARVYERLTQALFVVNLVRTPADMRDHLMRTAFLPGQAWAYTSITYQIGLADDFVGMHLEHSRVDAATLKAVLEQAQQGHWLAEPGLASNEGALIEPLEWKLPDDLADDLTREITAYRAQAEQLRLDTVRVPRPVPADLPFRISDDALCQWVMLYAQLATFGRVRSTYEAVDLRHYQAGRTECLRSVTPEAVTLVKALIAGRVQAAHLPDALSAHKDWIKMCKTGQGIDRHLTGLALMATATDRSLLVLEDAGWSRLTTDFLSTSSIGDHEQIVGMAFAPTSRGGIGINYTPLGEDYEFLVSSHRTQTSDIETFIAQLREGADALAALLAGMVEVPSAPA